MRKDPNFKADQVHTIGGTVSEEKIFIMILDPVEGIQPKVNIYDLNLSSILKPSSTSWIEETLKSRQKTVSDPVKEETSPKKVGNGTGLKHLQGISVY